MPGTSVIGLQWGDEAKGKLVDLLAERLGVDIVVRYQGGANAGHTVVIGDATYKLHQIPSGILTDGVMNVITPGVVFNPAIVLQEIEGLAARGIPVAERLMISDRAHVVFPWHIAEDRAQNADKVGGESIGTTLRGIGPCYRDKVGRMSAIRLGDMVGSDFRQRIVQVVEYKRRSLAGFCRSDSRRASWMWTASTKSIAAMPSVWRRWSAIPPITCWTPLAAGQNVLFEGAKVRCWTSITARFRL